MLPSIIACAALVAICNALPSKSRPLSHSKRQSSSPSTVSDISIISNYWGQIRPYADNSDNYFGVQNVGLPDGCGIEQVQILMRHGARYPTGATEDGENDKAFAQKVSNFSQNGGSFSGPLSFLKGYSYELGSGLLTESGAAMEFSGGVHVKFPDPFAQARLTVQAWNKYGRLLYNASAGQNYYNASFSNGTARPLPVIRTTSQPRILQSALYWAEGFFGYNSTADYTLVVIPEGGTENNTLASYDSCASANVDAIGYIGDADVYKIIPQYLNSTTQRLSQYFSSGFNLTTNDTYAMQSLCAYEYNALGSSDFCGLFTLEDWAGFEYTLDVEYAYDYAYQNPTGRAQGLGTAQEILARLQGQLITSSNSSVNSTLDGSTSTFGTANQPLYLDLSHDDILLSTLVALSYGFLNESLPLDSVPTSLNRSFVLSHLTPFGARLTTERIGCASANPTAISNATTQYTINSNGYSASNATYKFVRQRLNNGILPINTIQGASCNRTDGMCSLESFLASQADIEQKANYAFSCNGPTDEVIAGFNNDGASFPRSNSSASASSSASSSHAASAVPFPVSGSQSASVHRSAASGASSAIASAIASASKA